VHNFSKDHRLRALFATGIDTQESFAETPFAVVKREHRLYDIAAFPYEHPAMVAPMQRFVTIGDNTKGLTLITKGLPEYELKVDQRGVLALTLLRCVGKLSGRNLITRPGGAAGWWNETPEAQCLGTHTFEYSILPHAPLEKEPWSEILQEVEMFTVPPLIVKRKNNQTEFEKTTLSIHPESLLLVALKVADEQDAIVLRVNNPVDLLVSGTIHFEGRLTEAFRARMNEEIIEPLEVVGGHDIPIIIKPFEVITILAKL
jgi:alpha-mannosidase